MKIIRTAIDGFVYGITVLKMTGGGGGRANASNRDGLIRLIHALRRLF